MDISSRGLGLIKDYESYSSKAYLCPEGVPTIGWGSIRWDAKRPVKLGDTCTVEQAEELLRKEVILIEDAIDSNVKVPMTQGQFDCLCSWGYNVGVGWINGKRKGGQATLIKLLNQGKYDAVPSELVKFKRGAVSKKSYSGLLKRRKRELRELWFSDHGFEAPTVTAAPEERKESATAMPQSVAPDNPTPVAIAKRSRTIWMSLLGILATSAGQAWQWVFSVATEAGPELVRNQESLTPFGSLLEFLGGSVPLLMAIVAIGTLAVVIQRRIAQEQS